MFLFSKQFAAPTPAAEKKGIEVICTFIAASYVRVWYECPSSVKAPQNYLKFLKSSKQNEKKGKLWKAALSKFLNHLWYLRSSLAPFALFDSRVSLDVKRAMVTALQSQDSEEDPPKRIQLLRNTINKDLTLAEFVNKNSMHFFEILNL
ncbi:39S ribosomal protein L28, mitochondrial [Frankliniella fusca]|uniref:39S ribosomal protein L28, mitochondrial n=1 Tax=Frankliniella fusca TaxID=407009 RepID=A0AAE1HAW5_9NEOP|nr:39S ribosomal protein L28, mitochondrial [Frankliniella fusca]